MKELTRKLIAVTAVLCVAMASVAGCSSGNKNSSSSSSEEVILQIPFEYGSGNDNPIYSGDPHAGDLEADDPVANNGGTATAPAATTKAGADASAGQPVTDAKGEPVTEFVPVTDAAGQPATNAEGQPVTQSVIVTKPAGSGNSGNNNGSSNNGGTNNGGSNNGGTNNGGSNSGDNNNSGSTPSDYTSKTEGRYAMWLDISKDSNFFFEGDFLHVTFKIKEDTPAGDYNIRISPDIADISGRSVHEYTAQNGVIRVNNGSIDEAVPVLENDNSMLVYGDNVAAKNGDTVDYYINIKNNLGMCAFCIWFYYDANAMEFLECEPCGEYSEIASQTEVGGQNSNKPVPEE